MTKGGTQRRSENLGKANRDERRAGFNARYNNTNYSKHIYGAKLSGYLGYMGDAVGKTN